MQQTIPGPSQVQTPLVLRLFLSRWFKVELVLETQGHLDLLADQKHPARASRGTVQQNLEFSPSSVFEHNSGVGEPKGALRLFSEH